MYPVLSAGSEDFQIYKLPIGLDSSKSDSWRCFRKCKWNCVSVVFTLLGGSLAVKLTSSNVQSRTSPGLPNFRLVFLHFELVQREEFKIQGVTGRRDDASDSRNAAGSEAAHKSDLTAESARNYAYDESARNSRIMNFRRFNIILTLKLSDRNIQCNPAATRFSR